MGSTLAEGETPEHYFQLEQEIRKHGLLTVQHLPVQEQGTASMCLEQQLAFHLMERNGESIIAFYTLNKTGNPGETAQRPI